VFIAARTGGRIIGVSIHMRNSTAIALKFVGIAADWVKSREGVYFNVTYQKVIEKACNAGVQQLYLGILTYRPKCHRGARLVPTSSWVWEPTTIRSRVQRLLLSWQARRQERLLAHYTAQNQVENPLPCYKWPPQPRAG
jgi:CelD/BcsL family acetyltransferase involved in cellulose biosynthesis